MHVLSFAACFPSAAGVNLKSLPFVCVLFEDLLWIDLAGGLLMPFIFSSYGGIFKHISKVLHETPRFHGIFQRNRGNLLLKSLQLHTAWCYTVIKH